ncbi:MAG: asparagine--tRNA ligase [Candidatus Micrarchaeota archaeon]|nr:asparagine--tRNA ligase [Candidatus Micrarchaeota archaeon]
MGNVFTSISEILGGKKTGEVAIRGWVYRKRSSGGMHFVVVRDSTGVIQCAVKKDVVDAKSFENAEKVFIESSVIVNGEVKEDNRAPGGYEIQAKQFELVHLGEAFPIAKDQSVEFLLDTRHLWLRSQKLTNIMKARDYIVRYLREFFYNKGFRELSPPIITRAGCEGGSTLFKLDYFGKEAYLTQSGQLYNEAFITAFEKVFILAPSFRAEQSRTVRHLCEYWHLEPEMAWYSQEDNMKLQEEMVEEVCQRMASEHADLLKELGLEPDRLKKVKAPFPRIDYEELIPKMHELGFKKFKWGDDLGSDEEAALTKELEKPIFIHNFPKGMKAFYMREDPEKPGTVLASDLQAPGGHGELIGGSERIWEMDELLARMREEKLRIEDYQWYVDLRRYGSVPHSGFGLGIERLVKWMLNLDHIRDAIPFPRVINRVYP